MPTLRLHEDVQSACSHLASGETTNVIMPLRDN